MSHVDLFSGCGGLSLGFKRSGSIPIAAIDSDLHACATFQRNNPSTPVHCGDVFDFVSSNKRRFRGVDFLIGGPPCQGFCAINPKRTENDPRNSGLDAFLFAIEVWRPRAFVIENVPGLLSLGSGFALKKIQTCLADLNYRFEIKVLQAAYYGAPQSRWRLVVLGHKSNRPLPPEPSHRAEVVANFPRASEFGYQGVGGSDSLPNSPTVWDAISDLPSIENGGCYTGSAKYLNHQTRALSNLQMERVQTLKQQGMNWTDLPERLIPDNLKKLRKKYGTGLGARTRFGRLRWDGRFSTILTSPDPYWGAFIHPEQDRVISVRETARAQTFPDEFEFCGPLTSQYRQIGNAVPVDLAEAVAKAIS